MNTFDLGGSFSNPNLKLVEEKIDYRKQHAKTRAGGERSNLHMPMIDNRDTLRPNYRIQGTAGAYNKSSRSGRSNPASGTT